MNLNLIGKGKPKSVFTVKQDVLLMGTLQTSAATLVLIDSLSRASCNPREQVAIAFTLFSNIILKSSLRIEILTVADGG